MTTRHLPQDTEEKYGLLFDKLLEGVQIIDRDFRYIYVNEAVARQGKTTTKDLIGSRMAERYPGIEKTAVYSALRTVMNSHTPQTMENEFTFPDGQTGWFELRMEPIPEGVFILSIDITDRKRAEESRREMDEIKTIFIKTVTHHLRSPLSVVKWNLELCLNQKEMRLSATQKDFITAAYEANDQVIQRINDFLYLVEIAERRIQINREETDFTALVREQSSKFSDICRQKDLKMTIDTPPDKLLVSLDPRLIQSCVEKLVNNAIFYTPEKGVIEVRLSRSDQAVRFAVSDSGIGVPPSEQDNLYQRFFRGSNAFKLRPDAPGIGLYIVKKIIELHKGKVGFTSQEGRGSTFWFDIPL